MRLAADRRRRRRRWWPTSADDADLPLLRPGDTVWASWPPDAACVLPPADDLPLTDDELVDES